MTLRSGAAIRGIGCGTIILYVDNTTAEVILGKGKSKAADLNKVAGLLWQLIAIGQLPKLLVARVPSKLNPADAPSRARVTEEYLDGLWIKAPVDIGLCHITFRNVYE